MAPHTRCATTLQVQLEVFLTSVHLRIVDRCERPAASVVAAHTSLAAHLLVRHCRHRRRRLRSVTSPPEQRELALESLLDFCREPALMLDLYVNYDCDVHCTNLFETLCKCLSRHAQPEAGESLNILHLLALEGVLAVRAPPTHACAYTHARTHAHTNTCTRPRAACA